MKFFISILAILLIIARCGVLLKNAWLIAKKRIRRFHTSIFESRYIESKAFYMYRFHQVPCITYVYELNIAEVFNYLNQHYGYAVADIYQSCTYNYKKQLQEFANTIIVFNNRTMVELAGQYAGVLYLNDNYAYADQLVKEIGRFRIPEKTEEYEINIITINSNGLELKRLDIQPVKLDIDLYYNDDFKEVDAIIRARLMQDQDKGIILLHGLPGTGKTTYLRHLIGHLKKKVLFVSPSVAANLMNPEFIDLLIDNPNSVLVIEDAENIILDRKYASHSSVSNLLNLSDGLLSDCLNVQVICTFNSALSMVDSALLRKGRLIAKYEFGKLNKEKAQRLSDQLGYGQVITKPMTLAEITNPEEKDYQAPVQQIGFRRELTEV